MKKESTLVEFDRHHFGMDIELKIVADIPVKGDVQNSVLQKAVVNIDYEVEIDITSRLTEAEKKKIIATFL